jgi:hypothetical protein
MVIAKPVIVESVTIANHDSSPKQGEDITFSATVTGKNVESSQAVTWSVTGSTPVKSGTKFDATTVNKLFIAADELVGNTLTITATSTVDSAILKTTTVTVVSSAAVELGTVGKPALSDQGVVTWVAVDHASSYTVDLYKDAVTEPVYTDDAAESGVSVLAEMRNAAGSYTVTVTAIGDGEEYNSAPASEKSDARVVTQRLSAPNLKWAGTIAHWNNVEGLNGESAYSIALYKDGGSTPVATTDTSTHYVDTSDDNAWKSYVELGSDIATAGVGVYTFKVITKGDNALIIDNVSAVSGTHTRATFSAVSVETASITGYTETNGTPSNLTDDYWAAYETLNISFNTEITGLSAGSFSITDTGSTGAKRGDFAPGTGGDYTLTVYGVINGGAITLAVSGVANYSFALDSQNVNVYHKLPAVQYMWWAGQTAYWVNANAPGDAASAAVTSYSVQLYKGADTIGSPVSVTRANETNDNPNKATSYDFGTLIAANGGGTYTFKVIAHHTSDYVLDSAETESSGTQVSGSLVIPNPSLVITAVVTGNTAAVTFTGAADYTDISWYVNSSIFPETGATISLDVSDGAKTVSVFAKKDGESNLQSSGPYTVSSEGAVKQ